MLFSSFCWHREDIYLASINYNHVGAAKQWYGIPGSKAQKFNSTMEKLMKVRLKEVPDLEHHITTQINPQLLINNKVPVCKTTQGAGHFIVTFPQAYHCGFSYGFNCGEAVNFATADWCVRVRTARVSVVISRGNHPNPLSPYAAGSITARKASMRTGSSSRKRCSRSTV